MNDPRDQSGEALRPTSSLLRQLVEHVPASVAIFDREMRYIMASRRYCMDYGVAPRDLVGRLHYEVFPEIPERWKEAHRRCLAGATESAEADPFERADGRLDWVNWELQPWHDEQGEIGGVILFSEVVTERVQMQEALLESEASSRILLQDMPDLVCRWWPDGKLSYVNDNYCSYFGKTRDELIGNSFMPLIVAEDHARTERFFQSMDKDNPVDTIEQRVNLPHGEIRWQEWTNRCLFNDHGEAREFQSTGRDITRRKQAEAARLAEFGRVQAQHEVLNAVTNSAALMEGDLETLARQVTELVARAIGVERVNVWLFNEDETELHCVDLFEASPGRHSAGMVLRESEFGNGFRALKHERYVAADNPLTDPRTAGYAEGYLKPLRITSMLDAVIEISGRHMGLLCIEHVDQPHHWEADEIAFASQLADKLGLCIAQRQRRQVMEELQEAQRVSRLGNWQLSLESGAMSCSAEAHRIFGQDGAASTTTLEELVTPASFARLDAAMAECRASGRPFELDLEVANPPDKARWITARGEAVRDTNDTIVAVRGTVQDISERKRIEQLLRLQTKALEAAANAIVITDRQGLIEWGNPAFLADTGHTLEQARGKRPADLVSSGKQDGAFYERMWGTILSGKVWHGPIVNRRQDGQLRTEEMTITPVLDASDEISQFIAVKQDITDRLALEEQLHRAQRLESIGQLTGGVAHDFNNILTVVLGNAELLSESLAGDDRLGPLAEMVMQGAQRGAELTHRLLAFARRQPLDPQIADINELVTGLQGLFGRTLGEHVEIELACAEDLWPALVDPAQLESALLNLAINARDAMPRGGKLIIETRNTMLEEDYTSRQVDVRPGQYVRLSVSDSGCGIAPEDLERVLEPFYTTKAKGKGTGLGLAMVYGFAKQSEGQLKIYSEPGVGTTVHLYLPRPEDDVEPTLIQSSMPTSRGGTETILLVEDDDMVRRYAEGQLVALGYRVIIAGNGPEALAIVRRRDDIDLLFTDVVMPGGMNGRQLADAVLSIRPGVRVLYTSGYSENAIVHHGRLDPGVHLLGKPYRRSELAAKVREALADSRVGPK
ncbi:MAG TPA: PAS domain S-box protein [Gammaproteobacteria bacterium]|nr:PAS domain S-box protein [Gammaproteobacteria bacterium]